MKTIRFGIVGSLLLLAFACDKVTDPIVKHADGGPDTTTGEVLVRNILFEDYTGQDCPNCPAGTDKLKALLNSYPNLIAVAIHAGSFAVPSTKFPTDYRTPAGNFWQGYYKVGFYPAGLANRKKYVGTNIIFNKDNFASAVDQANKDPYILGLTPTVAFDQVSRTISSSTKLKFKDAYNDSVRVSALITEDNIIGKQNDNGIYIEDYEFEHVLRGTIGSADYWGERVPGKKFAAKEEATVTFPSVMLKAEYKEDNIYVIVFAFNERTKEVLQVERIKLIP